MIDDERERESMRTTFRGWSGLDFNFALFHLPFFGDEKHLYKRVCPSVRPSLRRSVTPSHFRRFSSDSKHRVAGISSCYHVKQGMKLKGGKRDRKEQWDEGERVEEREKYSVT